MASKDISAFEASFKKEEYEPELEPELKLEPEIKKSAKSLLFITYKEILEYLGKDKLLEIQNKLTETKTKYLSNSKYRSDLFSALNTKFKQNKVYNDTQSTKNLATKIAFQTAILDNIQAQDPIPLGGSRKSSKKSSKKSSRKTSRKGTRKTKKNKSKRRKKSSKLRKTSKTKRTKRKSKLHNH